MATETEPTTETVEKENPFIDSDDFIENELTSLLTPEEGEPESVETETEETEEEVQTTEETQESEEAEVQDEDEELVHSDDSKGVQKRINKAIRQKKEAEERADELEARIKRIEKGEKEAPIPALDRVKSSLDHDELDELETNAQGVIDYITDNYDPNGVVLEVDGKEVEYSGAELRTRRDTARATLKEIRSRRKVIDQAEAADAEILKAFPSLADKDSDESAALDQVFGLYPEIKGRADRKRAAIALYLGEVQLANMSKPKAKKAKLGRTKQPIEKAPNLGNPEEKAGLSKPKPSEGASKETLEKIVNGDDDALHSELLKMFT